MTPTKFIAIWAGLLLTCFTFWAGIILVIAHAVRSIA